MITGPAIITHDRPARGRPRLHVRRLSASPQFSVLERRDPKTIDLSARFSEHITLKRPLVSANMDTITRSAMAIVQAEEGGLGIIDRGFRGGDIARRSAKWRSSSARNTA